MKDKITFLMRSEGLSTTRLAELLEIQPSAVSHLASGRNKPSYDLLQKILVRFPRVNPDWLLLGNGDPYRPDILSAADDVSPEGEAVALDSAVQADQMATQGSKSDSSNTTIPINIRGLSGGGNSTKNPIFVVVFYDDGSCENFSMR